METSLRYLTEKASDVYDRVVFSEENSLYNEKAPEPWISFMIGVSVKRIE
jgi:hypothetical protein